MHVWTALAFPWQQQADVGACMAPCGGFHAAEITSDLIQVYASVAYEDKPRCNPRRAWDRAGEVWDGSCAMRLEALFKELFSLHDLNGDGLLEETELVTLNEMIAFLHYGSRADASEVHAKYKALFRDKLDPDGQPVPYEKFRDYTSEVVNGMDKDPEAQEMILEQFVAEAESGRRALEIPAFTDESDCPSELDGCAAAPSVQAPRNADTPEEAVSEVPPQGLSACCTGVSQPLVLGFL